MRVCRSYSTCSLVCVWKVKGAFVDEGDSETAIISIEDIIIMVDIHPVIGKTDMPQGWNIVSFLVFLCIVRKNT